MAPRLATVALAVSSIVALGCGDAHRPAVRGVVSESEPDAERPAPVDSRSASSAVSPHGSDATTPAPSLPADPGGPEVSLGPEVDLGKLQLVAPKDWVRKRPQISFIVAEFALPCAEGDPADGRLTVTVAGGSLSDNVDRWRKQFAPKPDKESQDKLTVSGVEVTLVDLSGAYLDQRGPFTPAEERKDYRMLGAIFDVDGQLHFLKAYGPAKTMAAQVPKFREFVQSLKKQ